MGEAWIIDAVRTPRGRGKREGGALSSVHLQELFAQSLNALRDRTGLDPAARVHVINACVTQPTIATWTSADSCAVQLRGP